MVCGSMRDICSSFPMFQGGGSSSHPAVQKAVQECLDVSETLQRLVGQGQETETRALDLVAASGDRGIVSDFVLDTLPATYKRLKEQKEKALAAAELWDQVAVTSQRCLDPTDGLLQALHGAAEVIAPAELNNEEEEQDRSIREICDVSRDLETVQVCTRQVARSSYRNVPDVSTRGPVLSAIHAQQEKVQTMFVKIGEMASNLASWAHDLNGGGGCCAQFGALGQAMAECLRHASLIQALSSGLRSLVEGIQHFMRESEKTLQSLLHDFPAVKKVGQFVHHHIGQHVGHHLGSLMGAIAAK